jgi:hypothetical protein
MLSLPMLSLRMLSSGPWLATLLASSLLAQTRFVADPAALPLLLPPFYQFAVTDIDRDGLPDLLATSPYPYLLHNLGQGFETATLPAGIFGRSAIGDLDGDGFSDLVVELDASNPNQQVFWYRNSGSGAFQRVAGLLPISATDFVAQICLGDVDGDGDLDILVASRGRGMGGPIQLLLNTGGGTFAAAPGNLPATVESGYAMQLVDLDGDGDLDIVRAEIDRTRVLINNGAGVFTDQSVARMPQHLGQMPTCIACGDLDGDGDIDLVFGMGTLHVLQNNGAGVFTDITAQAVPTGTDAVVDVALADFDGDGRLDIAPSTFDQHTGGTVQGDVLLNDGQGHFFGQRYLPAFLDIGYGIAAADFDRDGDIDLLVSGWNGNRVLMNGRRHLLAPPTVRVGGVLAFELLACQPGRPIYLTAGLSLTAQPVPVPVPGLGLLSLSPPVAMLTGQLLSVTDAFTQMLTVPALPALVGTVVHGQPLVINFNAPGGSGLGNHASFIIVP